MLTPYQKQCLQIPFFIQTRLDGVALEDTRKQAEAGEASAQLRLALHHLCIYDPKNRKLFFLLCSKAAEQGHAAAMRWMYTAYTTPCGVRANKKLANKWLQKAAVAGDAEAQYLLAMDYYESCAGLHADRQALKWFLKAAQQNHPPAQVHLFLMGVSYKME